MEGNNTQQQNVVCTLYSLLENAKLSDYYDRFLAQGGDDIDQLCEATEHEFKEITKLVGMHTKPLHIRRLQKALVEFWTEKQKSGKNKPSSGTLGPSWIETWNSGQITPAKSNNISSLTKPTTVRITTGNSTAEDEAQFSPTPTKRGRPPKGLNKNIKADVFELKLPAMEAIIDWENLDDERKQLIREHSRIYGRDTKKRKCIDLNSHEQIINEAAAQLCLRDPTLLVRRDELFTQARRIVRDSGFSFVHGHSRSKFAGESGSESMRGNKDVFRSDNRVSRQERLQEVTALILELTDRQVMLIKKRRELESTKQPTSDLQQELNNLTSQLTVLQTEQKQLQKKVRRSERYYHSKEAQRRSSANTSQPAETHVPIQAEIPSGVPAEEQNSVVVTEILQSTDDSSAQQGQNASEDPNGGRTLFAIIPQQGTALDQTTISTLLNLANDQEKLNTNNPQAIQSILSQIGLQNNLQIAPQQLISQLIPASTSEQTSITQDQQYVTQQSDMTVVDPLATSSPPTAAELINHVTTTSRAVLPSLQDPSLPDQYVQQQEYQV